MISLIQRVTKAEVSIKGKSYSSIAKGYVVFLGIFNEDTESDVNKLIEKIINLRIMSDEHDKMNLSILDVKGEILVVSQFTLCADLTGGRRPSFINAKKPEEAEKLYKSFVEKLSEKKLKISTGKFGEYMNVKIHNDGPVTIILDSNKI